MDAVFVWTPATGATAFGSHAGEVDELQLAGGHLVYRAVDPTGLFPTLYTADIAVQAPAQPIETDEPLVSPGTQSGVIGGQTLVSTAFGVAFQAVLNASFASPFLYTVEDGGAPGFVRGTMSEGFNVGTIPGFGFGSGIALDNAWVGTGNLGAQPGLFRVDTAGVTLLYGASANFVGDLAALGRTVLFGTVASLTTDQVLLHDLDTGTETILLANHTLGSVDQVGSRLVFTARDNGLFQNTNGDNDDDIWTLYSYEGGGSVPFNLGVLPRQDDLFGNQSPVRSLDEVGTTFLGDDDRVFWLQRNDEFGRGLEIHSLDFATKVITPHELVPGPGSGVVGAGDAVFANGRLHFVGSEDGSDGDRAIWTLAPDLSLSRVTGPDLRDPFGFHGELTVVNGEVFFVALDEALGFRRIFQMNDDGVTAERLALPGANPNMFFLEALGNDLGFVASDASGLRQLFRFTPGAEPGREGAVEQLTQFTTESDFLADPTLGGDGRIYFTRSVPAFGRELWVVDAAEAEGARLLADINLDPVPLGYEPQQVVAVPFLA
jgi:ELWxxDGT repeat protein